MTGPLRGLRVVELATGVAGPYAGRLLAMLGATVVKVEPDGGDPCRTLPVDDKPVVAPSPLFVHLNAGKRLATRSGVDLERLLPWADVIIDDGVRTTRAGGPLDPDGLRNGTAPGRTRVLATTTAWGYEAPDPGAPADELLVQAASGILTVSREEGREPI